MPEYAYAVPSRKASMLFQEKDTTFPQVLQPMIFHGIHSCQTSEALVFQGFVHTMFLVITQGWKHVWNSFQHDSNQMLFVNEQRWLFLNRMDMQ